MQKNLCTLLNVAKDDSSKMLQAINLFSPLIQKYSKKLFFIDREDAEQEMTLAFISTIHKMNYFHSPGECISFINKGLYRRFCVLCKENPQNAEMTEYSNAIVHAFQGFRAPFSGKIVHIFPEQSAAFN